MFSRSIAFIGALVSSALLALACGRVKSSECPGYFTEMWVDRIKVLDPPLVRIPGGTYVVGWDRNPERLRRAYPHSLIRKFLVDVSDLPPTRTVVLKPYYIGKYEVTVAEYLYYCRATGKEIPSWRHLDRHGLMSACLNYDEAVGYCRWLSEETGRHYRLPTSDEWEVAAQGPERWTFPWGDKFLPTIRHQPFGWEPMQHPNAYGIYHMGWGVAEWCTEKVDGKTTAVLRGGAWMAYPPPCDEIYFCAYKGLYPYVPPYVPTGLRLAADATEFPKKLRGE